MTLLAPSRRLLAGTAVALALMTGTAACSSDTSDGAGKTTTTKVGKTTSTKVDKITSTTVDGGNGSTTTTVKVGKTTTTTAAGGGDRSEQAYVDALVQSVDVTGELVPKGKATCIGQSFIDVIGFDAINASGLTPKEFARRSGAEYPKSLGIDEEKANELYDQFEACDIDLRANIITSYTSVGSPIDADTKACIEANLTDKGVRTSFVNSFLGNDDAPDPIAKANACLRAAIIEDDRPPVTAARVTPGN